jgi:hypothetical protein
MTGMRAWLKTGLAVAVLVLLAVWHPGVLFNSLTLGGLLLAFVVLGILRGEAWDRHYIRSAVDPVRLGCGCVWSRRREAMHRQCAEHRETRETRETLTDSAP